MKSLDIRLWVAILIMLLLVQDERWRSVMANNARHWRLKHMKYRVFPVFYASVMFYIASHSAEYGRHGDMPALRLCWRSTANKEG